MTHLFFVTSESEAKQAENKINRLPSTESFHLISNSPAANLFFINRQIPFKDSGDFFPAGKKLRSRQLKITYISKQWAKLSGIDRLLTYRGFQLDDIVSFSLFIYLAEVEHSLLVSQNILKIIKPDIVHVSHRWTESPFRRYQTENLNLENLALEGLSRSNRVKVIPLSQKSNVLLPIKNILQTAPGLTFGNAASPPPIAPLIVLANYYQLTNLFPFLTKLKTGNLNFTAIGKIDPVQLKLLNRSGIPFFPIESTRTISSLPRTVRYFYLWHQLKPKITRLFNSYHPAYWSLIEEKLSYLFTAEFPQITGYLNQAEKIFSHRPKVLLTMTTNDTLSRCFVEAAAHHKTKVIELQHGLVIFDEEAPFRKNDIHAVWGTPLAKIMNQGNRGSNSIAVTGFPYFDKYRQKSNSGLLLQRRKQKTILILATFPVAADRLIATTSPYRFLEIIFDAIKSQNENWKIVFRPHPSCNASWVKEMADNLSVDLTFDQRKTPLNKSISSSDLIISNFTSAMIDAMFIGKPILVYSFADADAIKLDNHPLITTGAVRLFSSIKELISLMNKIKQKKIIKDMVIGQQKFLNSYCSFKGKPANERLFDLINTKLYENSQ